MQLRTGRQHSTALEYYKQTTIGLCLLPIASKVYTLRPLWQRCSSQTGKISVINSKSTTSGNGATDTTTAMSKTKNAIDDETDDSNADVASRHSSGDDAEHRLAQARARNREHAKKTRLRKKAALHNLQGRIQQLEQERQTLLQTLEERKVAAILVHLADGGSSSRLVAADGPRADELTLTGPRTASEGGASATVIDPTSPEASSSSSVPSTKVALLTAGAKRKRGVVQALADAGVIDVNNNDQTGTMTGPSFLPLTIQLENGHVLEIDASPASHMNWKTGRYTDSDGMQYQLTCQQLEEVRRQRNRWHAKRTRDRKKCFLAEMEATIAALERENATLQTQIQAQSPHDVTPVPSPGMSALASPPFFHTAATTSDDDDGASTTSSSAYSQGLSPSNVPEPMSATHLSFSLNN